MKIPSSFLSWCMAAAVAACHIPIAAHGAGMAEHVVLIVWDGLRPDMVNAANTPTLETLRQEGTFFSRHHAVYPSTTEVNGTALATGMYPAHSGLVGNREFRPKINPNEPSATEAVQSVRAGDEVTGGKYLAVPTMYETLQAAGFSTLVAGTKPVALLPDRSRERTAGAAAKSVNVFAGKTLPETLLPDLEKSHGKFPEKPSFPDVPQNQWTVDVLLKELWKNEVPKLTLLWLSDPDYTQHDTQPGSEKALASLRENDRMLALLLEALKAKGVRDKTDVMLVSDHGFSTIDQSVDFASLLSEAGFRATRKFANQPEPGEILVVSNGGSVFFYVTGHDSATMGRLVDFLQKCRLCGVIFSSGGQPGTFPLSAAHINSSEAPDVVASLHWDRSPNASGVRGLIIADTAMLKKPGKGMHGSLSPYDMHNTLIANGPDFRAGYVNELPSGNIDIAPTVLWILGVEPAQKMDGRVLGEAVVKYSLPVPAPVENVLKNTSGDGNWQQYLKTTSVGGTEYLDEGNPVAPGG